MTRRLMNILDTEPPEWALREAQQMVARWEQGSEEHRQWLRDMCIPEVAIALAAARRRGIEEAELALLRRRDELRRAVAIIRSDAFDEAGDVIRALITKEPT